MANTATTKLDAQAQATLQFLTWDASKEGRAEGLSHRELGADFAKWMTDLPQQRLDAVQFGPELERIANEARAKECAARVATIAEHFALDSTLPAIKTFGKQAKYTNIAGNAVFLLTPDGRPFIAFVGDAVADQNYRRKVNRKNNVEE